MSKREENSTKYRSEVREDRNRRSRSRSPPQDRNYSRRHESHNRSRRSRSRSGSRGRLTRDSYNRDDRHSRGRDSNRDSFSRKALQTEDDGNHSRRSDSRSRQDRRNYVREDRVKPAEESIRTTKPSSKVFGHIMKELSKSNLRKDVQQSEAADSQLQRLIGSIQATQSATSSETPVSISIQKHNPGGVTIRDGYNFGNKPDIASIRSMPFLCSECESEFMLATQVSDHLLAVHNIRKHTSLIRPRADESFRDFQVAKTKGTLDPMDV